VIFTLGEFDAQISYGCMRHHSNHYTHHVYRGLASASVPAPAGGSHGTIVVPPGQSIQAAVNRARPGTTIQLEKGVYHQAVQIRKDGITLRGVGNSLNGTVLKPPAAKPHTLCTVAFGVTRGVHPGQAGQPDDRGRAQGGQ
jgi:hypothetical protein